MSQEGRSARNRYFEASTAVVPARQSREFWRFGVLNRSEADFPAERISARHNGSVRTLVGAHSQIRDGRSDAVILRRTAQRCRRDGADEILLSAVLHIGGALRIRGSDDVATELQSGDIVVHDFAKPYTIDTGPYREVNFRLARPLVAAAIGCDPAFLHGRVLPKTPLTKMLFANLRDFADALPAMEEAERAAALDASTEFTLQTLDFVVGRFRGPRARRGRSCSPPPSGSSSAISAWAGCRRIGLPASSAAHGPQSTGCSARTAAR